jgi:hypothetical protein
VRSLGKEFGKQNGEIVDSLERFHQSRAVIDDFSTHTLAAISTAFGRLYYVNSLKDSESGCYVHEGLTSLYPEGAVQEGLAQCHEELFVRILETPLREQELDLKKCLRAAGERYGELMESWGGKESLRDLCPEGVPEYLHDLFCSNMSALLSIASNKAN